MKALSIRQPWCWLILNAGKDIENRNWSTRYRGRIFLHAAKGMTRDEFEMTERWCVDRFGLLLPAASELQRGGIVGAADIIDCVDHSDSRWFEGRFGLKLANVTPLPFRPFKGALGFFDVPDEYANAA